MCQPVLECGELPIETSSWRLCIGGPNPHALSCVTLCLNVASRQSTSQQPLLTALKTGTPMSVVLPAKPLHCRRLQIRRQQTHSILQSRPVRCHPSDTGAQYQVITGARIVTREHLYDKVAPIERTSSGCGGRGCRSDQMPTFTTLADVCALRGRQWFVYRRGGAAVAASVRGLLRIQLHGGGSCMGCVRMHT